MKARFLAAGVWVRPFGRLAYLTPALTITGEDLATLLEAMVAVAGDEARTR